MAIHFPSLLSFLLTIWAYVLPSNVNPLPGTTTQAEPNNHYPSYNYGFDPTIIKKRQSFGTYAVTGVLGGIVSDGGLPQRLEIRELEKNADLWPLYLLGLDMMQ